MKLTIEKVRELAYENFEKGGDGVAECYSDEMIQNLIDSGINTKGKLLKWFKGEYEIDEEHRKAALWAGYGTTDEEEIHKMKETEDDYESDIDHDYTDPCFGCMACDHSYNCKHCPHGDDGRYESPFDVYTPSELGISVKW